MFTQFPIISAGLIGKGKAISGFNNIFKIIQGIYMLTNSHGVSQGTYYKRIVSI